MWRLGASYDLTGSGRTALKASYSRYGLQVGIDRVTNVNPFSVGSADCPWTDPNGNRKYDVGEINLATCPAFSGGSVRRTTPTASSGRIRTRSPPASRRSCPARSASARCSTTAPTAIRSARSTRCSRRRPTPGTPSRSRTAPAASLSSPKPTTADVYNISAAANTQNASIRDNAEYLDTEYKGVEFTATKRFSRKWQMQAGFTIGKNEGGVQPAGAAGTDLNDPNNTRFPTGIIGNDSEHGAPPVGQLRAAVGHQPVGLDDRQQRLPVRVDLLADPRRGRDAGHHADPRQPDDSAERARRRALRERDDVRPASRQVVPLRRPGRFTPEINFFNITNADTVVNTTVAVGPSYLLPAGGDPILSPRIIRVGFALSF